MDRWEPQIEAGLAAVCPLVEVRDQADRLHSGGTTTASRQIRYLDLEVSNWGVLRFGCGVRASEAVIDKQVPLRVTLDEDADAAYVYLVRDIGPGGVARTVTVDYPLAMINLDFDTDGRLLGVEVVGAGRVLPSELTGLLRPS